MAKNTGEEIIPRHPSKTRETARKLGIDIPEQPVLEQEETDIM